MEGRVSRGRGGSWKRSGRGGHDSESSGGERRGRGRGGHHRGRGKRDYHRGRGRGGSGHGDSHQQEHDEDKAREEEDYSPDMFSRRKLESNWDRYEESERQQTDDDVPAQRGTDFHVLLQSAGDSFTQFRFSEEKDWELDPLTTSQMSEVSLDLPALAQMLQQLPLHHRLNLEAGLDQISTPAELPTAPLAPKPDAPKTSRFVPPVAEQKAPEGPTPAGGSQLPAAAAQEDDTDEELEQLLTLQTPLSHDASVSGTDQPDAAPQKTACEEVKVSSEGREEKMEDAAAATATAPPEPPSVKREMTEEDLEDWLDSMIS